MFRCHDPLISRRRVILVSSSVAAAVSTGLVSGCGQHFQPTRVLSDAQRRLVEAVADQIVPPDQDPGGKAAGVADFLDIQLRGPYARFLDAYRIGLARLDDVSVHALGKRFIDLPFDAQTALLVRLDTGQVPATIWNPRDAVEFFRLVCDHCMQAYYGSPRHGGNRGAASWKMLGLDYPQVAGRVVVK